MKYVFLLAISFAFWSVSLCMDNDLARLNQRVEQAEREPAPAKREKATAEIMEDMQRVLAQEKKLKVLEPHTSKNLDPEQFKFKTGRATERPQDQAACFLCILQ